MCSLVPKFDLIEQNKFEFWLHHSIRNQLKTWNNFVIVDRCNEDIDKNEIIYNKLKSKEFKQLELINQQKKLFSNYK